MCNMIILDGFVYCGVGYFSKDLAHLSAMKYFKFFRALGRGAGKFDLLSGYGMIY